MSAPTKLPTLRQAADAEVTAARETLRTAALTYAISATESGDALAAATEQLYAASAAHGAALSFQRLAEACARSAAPAVDATADAPSTTPAAVLGLPPRIGGMATVAEVAKAARNVDAAEGK